MKHKLQILLILMILISCNQKANKDLADRKEKIEEIESSPVTQDQADRKTKSIEYCKANGIPAIDHLPYIESENETVIRDKEEIIRRAFVLCYLGLKSEGLEKEHLDEFDKKYQVSDYFTDDEKLYVNATSPTEQQRVNASWRYESLHVLLWALGYIDSLDYPSKPCNVAEDVKLIFGRTKTEFSSATKLRTKKEILDQADLIYRIDWACVDARENNRDAPAKLDPAIVYERHYALNWLINYMEEDWDDVSTDT